MHPIYDPKNRDEYVTWLTHWIHKKDLAFGKRLKAAMDSGRPLRHPNGQAFPKHDRRYYWSDLIWCQDISMCDCPEEFTGAHPDWPDFEYDEDTSDKAQEYLNNCFDQAFRATLPPEFHNILEG